MNKRQRDLDRFKRTAGWYLGGGQRTAPVLTALDKKRVQSKLRTMSDAEVDRLLKEAR